MPSCSTNVCVWLYHMIGAVLIEVWKSREDSALCKRTEDMIAEIGATQDVQEDHNQIIESADVIALYPILDAGFTIDKVCEDFLSKQSES